jgi:hypothetical protein
VECVYVFECLHGVFRFLVFGLGVVEGKSVWRDYRKRSRLIECAKVERKVESAERE